MQGVRKGGEVGMTNPIIYTSTMKPVVYAHWEPEPDRLNHWHCSACGKVQGIACIGMNYCPNCGAELAEHEWLASGCGQAFSPDKED